MVIEGEWYPCDDGVMRPVVRGEVVTRAGKRVLTLFLVDTGADRTVLDGDTFVVEVTLRLREVSRGAMPPEYIFISDDGGDFKFYIDTSQVDAEGESPVVALGPGAEGIQVADNFNDFLTRWFEDRLDW